MLGGYHSFHNKTVKLFQTQKSMVASLRASKGKKKNESHFPFMKLIKKKEKKKVDDSHQHCVKQQPCQNCE